MSKANKKQARNQSLSELKEGDGGPITLDQLKEGDQGPIVVMICMQWDVHNINGRYLSTDFVVLDEKVT